MKNRIDLLLFYTEHLGFAKFEQFLPLFQASVDIEDYLTKRNPQKILLVKFLLLKHYLMEMCILQGVLSKDQAKHLISQKVQDVRKVPPPFSLFSIDVQLISPVFLKEALRELNKDRKFLFAEFRQLLAGVLVLPEKYLQEIKILYTARVEIPRIRESLIQEGLSTRKRYEIQCICGKGYLFEIEEGAKMKMFCCHCKKLLLELGMPKAKTLAEVAPDVAEKIKVETQRFSSYKLLKKLGEGASGKVYLAENSETGEKVALKVLIQSEEEQHLNYFKREIEMLSKLQHPNIVSLKNWGVFEGKPYLVMEYIAGETLEEVIDKNKRIPLRYATKIFISILDALIYAQQLNFIHRDIKPANIIISDQGIKLIDLGIAKVVESSIGLTKTGQIMGTPYYIAPEQVNNFKRVDHRADIYSLGASLFHALYGQPPFAEHSGAIMKLLWHKVRGNYLKLRELMPELPHQILSIIEKAMAQEPENRYSSADIMKQDLLLLHQNIIHRNI